MAINLHYGPPGTYKTSGAILDDLPKALKAGRVLITNIRGLKDPSKVKQAYRAQKKFKFFSKYKISDDFEIIFLDTRKEEDREKLRRFFHWSPQDAYFIIDEINTIFPKKWTERKLEEFDLHSGKPEELIDSKNFLTDRSNNTVCDTDNDPILRPQNLTEALEMHRHYNWDFSLTSPSYKKFHPVFFDVAEVAYKHINRAVVGVTGFWEIMHLATNAGNAKGDQLQQRVREIPQFIFDLYGSTATGEVRDSTAGRNIFLQPKIFLVLFLVIGLFSYAMYELSRLGMFGETKDEKEVIEAITPSNTTNQKGATPSNLPSGGHLIKTSASHVISAPLYDDFLEGYEITLAGTLMGNKLITLKREDKQRQWNVRLLVDLGYSFRFLDDCAAIISHSEFRKRFITCELRNQDTDYSLLPNGESVKPVPAVKKVAPLIKNPFKSPEN